MGDPTTLLALHTTHGGDECCNQFPYPVYADLRDQAQSFAGVAAYDELIPASISGSGEPERVWGQAVTSNFFSVTELPMVLGRGFGSGEENASTQTRPSPEKPFVSPATPTPSSASPRRHFTALTRFSTPSSGCRLESLRS